ncbi:plastocyanin/azurin family copper-binding protein [Natrinema halophilum]|uniref:plastocyanin/azurin family copper-binding protein n=1 Tax=Natrinema halophilum TaxID=1699371 RepID=UPI001F3D75DA|nr:plastocyanin/azurin family copper-binding protein [Natrinema halophilum]UHQ96086.1 plastocyanin/azurin family copper-binding protein [Natrinema halophilum]
MTVAGLAGCLGGSDDPADDDSSDGDSDTPTDGNDGQEDEDGNQSGNESDTDETDGASGGANVTMLTNDSGTHFDPHVVRIEPGESVTWTLESGSHTTTAYASANDRPQRIPDDAEAWDSGTISEQETTFEHTFETEGIYDYYCSPHERSGMIGSVVVGDPDLGSHPGMAEPQSELSDTAQEKIHELNEMVRNDGDGGHSHENGH